MLSTRPDQSIPPRDHRPVCVRTPAGRDEWEGMMQKKSYFHKQICHGIVQLLVLRLKRAIETQNISQPFYTRTQREIWMGKRSLYMCPFSHESLALSISLSLFLSIECGARCGLARFWFHFFHLLFCGWSLHDTFIAEWKLLMDSPFERLCYVSRTIELYPSACTPFRGSGE